MLAAFTYVNFYLAAPPFRLGTQALAMIFVVYLAGAVITPFAGRLIDRLGHRATVLIAFSGGIAGISLTLLHTLPAVMTGLAVCSTGVFIANAAGSGYVGVVTHEARAAAVGLYVTFYYTGGSFGSALPGGFWSRGGWPACVALIAAVQLLAIAMALFFWRPLPKVVGEPAAAVIAVDSPAASDIITACGRPLSLTNSGACGSPCSTSCLSCVQHR
jgi:MFS family permease